jgi:integrase
VTGISLKRWRTIKCQLNYFPIICGENTQLSTLNKEDLYEYSVLRNEIKVGAVQTIRMEKSTINHMIKFAYRNNLIHFESFNFKQIIIKGDLLSRRGTFTEQEYDKLVRFMRSFSSLKHAKERIGNRDFKMTAVIETKEQNQLERLMIRDYVLALANTCMRVGEILQLTWGCVGNYETHNKESEYEDKKKEQILVEIEVRAETSKVRKHRKFLCRGGQYFLRLKERQQHTNDEDLVFSMNGKKSIHDMRKRKYWEELMEGIGITNWEDRKLSWYSLRHFGITQRVQSGVDLIDISKMCGTSVKHISDTYLHYRKEQSRTAALKSYKKQEGQIKFL